MNKQRICLDSTVVTGWSMPTSWKSRCLVWMSCVVRRSASSMMAKRHHNARCYAPSATKLTIPGPSAKPQTSGVGSANVKAISQVVMSVSLLLLNPSLRCVQCLVIKTHWATIIWRKSEFWEKFASAEHLYQHTKAIHGKRPDLAKQIAESKYVYTVKPYI